MSQVQEEKTCLIAGLCDDEQYIHKVIEELLECYKTENNIDIQLIHYDSAEQLLDQRDELDFLLLDIEMPEMDGIGLGYKLKERNVKYKIIMLTAREDRFREAFKIGAFRFISKPVDKTELFEAIDAVRERIIVLQKVTVYKNGISYDIPQTDILYVEADNSSTLIFTDNHEFRSDHSLATWEETLDERIFFRSHKSFIVNIGKIDEIQTNVIRLVNGDKVSVSRRLRKPLLNAYMEYDLRWR